MTALVLAPELSREIGDIYAAMAAAYDQVAHQVPLTCNGCPDNCCDSYFLHHTYSEWAYLWEGLQALPAPQLERIRQRARDYLHQAQLLLVRGERPQLMCPLNEGGLCSLYSHRLMICRTHGVPATLTRPDGQVLRFPGCFRCQEIVQAGYPSPDQAPAWERTPLFKRLALLEANFLGKRREVLPRVKLTIAEMLVNGPPQDPGAPSTTNP